MVRYFMTIPEASQLVLQASGQGKNGEIYILDMGEPVRIVDLARDLIRLSGLQPDVDIKVEFSGMRPGEKLFEELMTKEERGASTAHEKIFVGKVQPFSSEELEATIMRMQDAALNSDHVAIRKNLESFVEGCQFNYKVVGV
jgi:FlaA1/EpsC-like NDP-sugar epimerase